MHDTTALPPSAPVLAPTGGRGFAAVAGLSPRTALALAAIAVALLGLGFETGSYLLSGATIDHIEDTTVIAAAQYRQGAPLYGLVGQVPHAATYYGPLAYLVEGVPLWLFGPTLLGGKLLSLLAMLGALALPAIRFLRRERAAEAAYPILYLAGAVLLFAPVSFWVRPDPFEMLCVAAAVVLGASPWGVGVCIGLAVNFKVHAFLYCAPLVVDLWCRGGWRALLRLALAAGGVFLLPFLLPGISLHDYVTALAQQVGGRPPSTEQLGSIVCYLMLMCVPIALPLLTQPRPWPERIFPIACLATVALLLYPASFPGAGAYHLMPLVPVLAEARHRLRPQGAGTEFDLLPVLFYGLYGILGTRESIGTTRGWDRIAGEALTVAQANPGRSLQIGYGSSKTGYGISQIGRTVLAINGYAMRYDAQLLMELRQIGRDESSRWTDDLAQCRVDLWLLPKGEPPFRLKNFYYSDVPLFGEAFRAAFAQHYRQVGGTVHFDLWACVRQPL